MHRVGLSALAQPRLTKGGQPYQVTGRPVIAMAAVRRGACQQPSEITDHPEVRPPTDAMSSHPYPFHSPFIRKITIL